MQKRLLIPFLILVLLLAGCSQALSAPEPISDFRTVESEEFFPAEEPAFAGGEFDDASFQETIQATPGSDGLAPGERIVIKNASLSVSVNDPAESMDAIFRMAEQMGGFVVSSNLFYYELESGLEVPQASITIRVPADQLDAALAAIESGSGRTLSKNISGQDVTREYTDLQSRLRNLQEAEAQLQEIMGSATKTEDVLSVYNQLVSIREQIEVIQGQIQFFEQSAAFSMISIELIADAAVQPLNIAGWQPAGVARAAIQALINTMQGLGSAAIWIGLYILPIGAILVLVVYLIWRIVRRLWTRTRPASAGQAE